MSRWCSRRDTPLNLMVLAGLAVGMAVMVDDAIAGTERVVAGCGENGGRLTRPDVAIAALRRIAGVR